jgi:4-amino-4-deoxy-L-arabinose transferase-like glycosyltransferase
MPHLSRYDWVAVLLSLLGVAAAAWVTFYIYEAVPHIEDEFAYTWQAQAIANGHLTVPTPPEPRSFLIPFVVDYNGQRFGKYPPGWSALLAVGVALDLRGWVNPLLAGLGIWFTYRLGKRVFTPAIGLLAATLTLTSPFFLMNSGALLTHPMGLALTAAFALGWLESFASPETRRSWLAALAAALALGLLVLSRPLTALAVALPFGVHGVYLLIRGSRRVRLRLVSFGLLVLLVSLVYPLWQYAVTGDPWLNTYTLWWPYDKIGFGPGIGATDTGHTLENALFSARRDLIIGASDIFGWPFLSYMLLPFGLWAGRRSLSTWLAGSAFFMLVIAYMAYWVGGSLYGPRYFYEGLPGLAILTAAGAAWLGGFNRPPDAPGLQWAKGRKLAAALLMTALVVFSLFFYTPNRLQLMYRLFGIGRAELSAFQAVQDQALTPALIFVDAERWMPYAIYTDLETPELTSPFIFAWSIGPNTDASVASHFPDRAVYYYYPDEPGVLYPSPRMK